MEKSKHLSSEERFAINVLAGLGVIHCRIASCLGRSKGCISKYLNGKSYKNSTDKRGRKSIISERMGRSIKRLALSEPVTSKYIKFMLNIQAHTQTIREYMRKMEYCGEKVIKQFHCEAQIENIDMILPEAV